MCFSPCFIAATQGAFVQRQLLQCRTCGSQAFHVLDCCRSPDYVRVPTSHLGERLKAWLGGLKAMVHSWRLQPLPRPPQPMPPAALDAWETRPIVVGNSKDFPAPQDVSADKLSEEVERETVAAHR
jgi:hypothetical protein